MDRLPAGLRGVARYGYVAKDTALFQILQKWIQYSDFVMKAIYFDHLMEERKKQLQHDLGYPEALKNTDPALDPVRRMEAARQTVALAHISEEYNNYDLPTGRGRQYLESIGAGWFLNYPIRATKVGLSMLRNNPASLFMGMAMPHPMAGGIPFTDNIFGKLFRGTIWRSLGPGMMFRPIAWNVWYNLFGN